MNLFSLSGKVIVITGAGGGIGGRVAEVFGNLGANLALVDRDEVQLRKKVTDLKSNGIEATEIKADITNETEVQSVVNETIEQYGKIDVLVNAAGVIRRRPITEVSIDDLDFHLNVNLRGLFMLTQEIIPHMIAAHSGKIIHVSSISGMVGSQMRTAYAVSKGAVRTYTQSLGFELAKYNICVNSVAPGFVTTSLNSELTRDPKQAKGLASGIPMKRLATPQDLDGVFVFLASSASNYMTCQTLVVDGGRSAGSVGNSSDGREDADR